MWPSRTPMFCCASASVTLAGEMPGRLKHNVGVRDGHMYSPRLMKRLGLTKESGAVRASLVHYNTMEEVQKFQNALAAIAKSHD
jgi:selenocysteine lyase/cysteine desulfurase